MTPSVIGYICGWHVTKTKHTFFLLSVIWNVRYVFVELTGCMKYSTLSSLCAEEFRQKLILPGTGWVYGKTEGEKSKRQPKNIMNNLIKWDRKSPATDLITCWVFFLFFKAEKYHVGSIKLKEQYQMMMILPMAQLMTSSYSQLGLELTISPRE